MNGMSDKLLRWLFKGFSVHTAVFFFYAGTVAFVSLRPAGTCGLELWDKAMHMMVYAIFAVLGYRVFTRHRHYFYGCLGIVAYGGLIEVAQSFTPDRLMSGLDFLGNTLGVVLGGVCAVRVGKSPSKPPFE